MNKHQIEQLAQMKDWTENDAIMAMFEGWCITNTSQDNIVIARFDQSEVFKTDYDASIFVMSQFLGGSGLAAKAIYYLINGNYEKEI